MILIPAEYSIALTTSLVCTEGSCHKEAKKMFRVGFKPMAIQEEAGMKQYRDTKILDYG
jgi:hypothetical protein